jgi:hypothetical protein
VYDYYGRVVDPTVPATDADCLPFRCGAQTGNTNAHFWCAYWGRAGNFSGCTDPRCVPFKPSYCVAQYNAPASPARAPAPSPGGNAGGGGGGSQGGGGGDTSGGGGTVVVQTPTGPVTVPATVVPGVASGTLTPAQIHIPNVWDSLDPSKLSQFEFRGLSLSLPSWISAAFRDSLVPRPVAAAGASLIDVSAVPGWVWLLILGALLLMGRKKARGHRSVKHGK